MATTKNSSEAMPRTSPGWRHHSLVRLVPIFALGAIYFFLNGTSLNDDAQGRTGMDKLLNEPVLRDEPLIFNEPVLKENETEEQEGEALPVLKETVKDSPPPPFHTDPLATPSTKSAKAKGGDSKSKGGKAEPKSKSKAAKAEGAKAEKHDAKSKSAKGGSKSKKSKGAKSEAASAKAEKHDGKATKGSAKSAKSKEKSKGGAKSEKKSASAKSASAKSAKAAVEKIALEVQKEIVEEVEAEYDIIEDAE
eukprot:scaffold7508_cov149-Skeletonema_menzelii.AAC.3